MRTKQGVSISTLNSVFLEPLNKFDELHKRLTGNQVVITSSNGSKHWGSIKKENRPFGWENFTEMQVRELSDSKHYNIPCDALDFRRRCPDGELTYYDDLTESQQRHFRTEIYECFPDDRFDVVFSRLCLHIEFDPKPRKLTDEDLEIKTPDLDELTDQQMDKAFDDMLVKPTELKKPKFNISTFELINWKIIPKALMNGVFRYFTKFNLFLIAHRPSWMDKLIELLRTLIRKMKGTKK